MSLTRTITVAAGAFAPGHLGELTRIVPFELVDCLLEEVRARERRVRLLPSRVGVYFMLALCLFPQDGYLGVWGGLTAALDGLGLAVPSAKALRCLRRRVGAAPLRLLFEALAGPLGWARQLLHLPGASMLVLMDRGFDGGTFLAEVAATRAQFLVRLNGARRPPPAGPGPAARQLLYQRDRRGEGPGHRRLRHRHLPRRYPLRRRVPPGHHPAGPPGLPRDDADIPLP
jgi:hypothetical protein